MIAGVAARSRDAAHKRRLMFIPSHRSFRAPSMSIA